MVRRSRRLSLAVAAAATALGLGLGASAPLWAGGFSIFEQGTKAMGMAGAFTAQADDGSAMFHNVGGLAFLDESEDRLQAGFTYISGESDFTGGSPFPGPGVTEQQVDLGEFLPHVYWVRPLNERLNFGLAVNSPFGLKSEWEDKDNFTGRFISEDASLLTIDVTPNIGWKLNDRMGFGFGLILRFAEVELNRRQALVNPVTLQPTEVAKVNLESDLNEGFGFQFGFLHRFTEHFTWGFSYRSAVDLEFDGDGRLTQVPTGIPPLDGLVAATLPLGRNLPIATELEYPSTASLGVAVQATPRWLVEVDANFTGWSSVDELVIDFTDDSLPDVTLRQGWDDVMNFRLGISYQLNDVSELRFGTVWDDTPQPDADLGPLIPDAKRNGFTIGYGRRLSGLQLDLALMRLLFDKRTTTVSEDGYNGTYDTDGWLIGVTVGW